MNLSYTTSKHTIHWIEKQKEKNSMEQKLYYQLVLSNFEEKKTNTQTDKKIKHPLPLR